MSDNANVQTISREVIPIPIGIDPSETTRRIPTLQECKAYLLGALHDGTYNAYNKRHRFAQKGTEWLLVLKEVLERTGNSSWIYKEGRDRDVYVLETRASFLDIKFDPLNFREQNEKLAYIRGFFDAEGGIPHSREAPFYIQLVQKDRPKIVKIKNMLESLGIRSGKIHNPSTRVDPDYWRLYIPKDSQMEFIRQITPWHPKKHKILEERKMI